MSPALRRCCILSRMRGVSQRSALALAATLGLAAAAPVAHAGPSGPAVDPAAARATLASIRPDPGLQAFLDHTLDGLLTRDAALRRSALRVAVLDLGDPSAPRLAQRGGDAPIYPASVIKFVYLMAAYALQDEGRLAVDAGLDAEIEAMIRVSSNVATQRVFARITGTEPGPALAPADYAAYREKRLGVQRWLAGLGVEGLHCVNPTYDGGGDIFGRDEQFLRDRTIEGGLASEDREFPNRNAMTANGTVQLLALLATDRALTPASSESVRRRMERDPRGQPHLAARIAGGAARRPGLTVYAKSGTWGPIYADAGIVRDAQGRSFAIAVFTEARPPYRGTAIADLTQAAAARLLGAGAP